MSESDNKRLRERLLEIDDRGRRLTSSEIDFVADLIDRDVQQFSPKQAASINKIYRERVLGSSSRQDNDDL